MKRITFHFIQPWTVNLHRWNHWIDFFPSKINTSIKKFVVRVIGKMKTNNRLHLISMSPLNKTTCKFLTWTWIHLYLLWMVQSVHFLCHPLIAIFLSISWIKNIHAVKMDSMNQWNNLKFMCYYCSHDIKSIQIDFLAVYFNLFNINSVCKWSNSRVESEF